MRQIKFRAWNKQYKHIRGPMGKMEYGLEVGRDSIFHDGILMQFTGLRDMKGIEIWEGDILKHDLWGTDVVVWDDMCANFRCKTEGEKAHDITLAHHQLKRTKVIGNIYENPALLDKTERV